MYKYKLFDGYTWGVNKRIVNQHKLKKKKKDANITYLLLSVSLLALLFVEHGSLV